MRISWLKSKNRLAALWFAGAGILFGVLLFQTILGQYAENASEAWEWFMPSIMPTLSLIVAVLAMDAMEKHTEDRTVDGFFFRLSFTLSLVYLVVALLTVLMQPFATLPPVALMERSNLWLGPLQGLVSASLGVFFIRGARE